MANTGRLEKEQRDENPNSPTFGQTRWVDGGLDVSACPLPQQFRSAAISENVTRNDCPSGQYGSTVPITMAAGVYTSTVSQLDADAQARAAFDASKQDQANQYGSCSLNPSTQITWLPIYSQVNCFDCQMVNRDDSSDIREATGAEVAHYFRANDRNNDPCPQCF